MLSENPRFLQQLKNHEGFRSRVYRCTAGFRTVGYGHNLDANPVRFSEPMGRAEAEELLKADCRVFENDLDEALPWWRDLNDARRAVLLNMAFNLGMSGLLKFQKTLSLIRHGDFLRAGNAMLESKWARQVKGRAAELAAQMQSGCWPN